MDNIEEKLKETILNFIAEKYEVHELTQEIEDTVEHVFSMIKKLSMDPYEVHELTKEIEDTVFSIIKKLSIENKTELKNMIKNNIC